MITFSKIVVGCDFSEYSKETLEYAASLAEKCQAKLIIVNVINQRDVETILEVADKTLDRTVVKNVEKLADDYVEREIEKRTQQIEKLVEEISCTHLSVKKVVRVGVPFQELTHSTERWVQDISSTSFSICWVLFSISLST